MRMKILPVLAAVILVLPLYAEVDRDLLLGLLRIPSVTKDQEQNNRAVEYMKRWFDAHGVFTAVETNEAGRTALYAATVPGKCHDIVFITHLDVVPPSRDGQFEPIVKDGFYSSWAQYTVQLPAGADRKDVQAKLKAAGIPSMVYYMKPMHTQGAFRGTDSAVADCPVTDRLCATVLSLPMDPYKTKEDVDFVVAALKKAL